MKKILTLLMTSVLSVSPSLLIINNNLFVHNQKNKLTLNPRSIALKFAMFEQTSRNFCTVASIQEIVFYLTRYLYNQNAIAQMARWTPQGIYPQNALNTLNTILRDHQYNNQFNLQYIPQNFAAFNSPNQLEDTAFFQAFIYANLLQNNPVLLGVDGSVPWLPGNSVHDFNIIGIDIINDNVYDTIYTVSENNLGETRTFSGQDLENFFTNGVGSAISLTNNFNFASRQVTSSIPAQSDKYIKTKTTLEESATTDLTKQAGLFSTNQVNKIKKISLPKCQIISTTGEGDQKSYTNVSINGSSVVYQQSPWKILTNLVHFGPWQIPSSYTEISTATNVNFNFTFNPSHYFLTFNVQITDDWNSWEPTGLTSSINLGTSIILYF